MKSLTPRQKAFRADIAATRTSPVPSAERIAPTTPPPSPPAGPESDAAAAMLAKGLSSSFDMLGTAVMNRMRAEGRCKVIESACDDSHGISRIFVAYIDGRAVAAVRADVYAVRKVGGQRKLDLDVKIATTDDAINAMLDVALEEGFERTSRNLPVGPQAR